MRRLYTALALVTSGLLLVSYSIDPPNGKTGAPGDSFCTECHVQPSSAIHGLISLEGFPSAITPNQNYTLTVVSRDTSGNAAKGGFQMTILGPTNTKAGTMASPSSSSALANASGRQYFEHRPAVTFPDSNVIRWNVSWTAPDLPAGSKITYYLAGNLANGDFLNTGDRIVAATGSGDIVLSANREIDVTNATLYPNPGHDIIFLQSTLANHPEGTINFFDMNGALAGSASLLDGRAVVPDMAPGMYGVRIQLASGTYYTKWIKV